MFNRASRDTGKNLITIFLVLISVFTASAQLIEEKVFSKLVIPRNQMYLVTVDTLEVDTLIMQNRSALKFTKDIVITVHNAYIGSACEFNASGAKSAFAGDGSNGKHLTMRILFKELNSLRMITSGGDGGRGSRGLAGIDGFSGSEGTNGQNGGNGGNGGDAGDISLYYIADGFIPLFNGASNRINSINFIYNGGKSGSGGYGGRGGKGGTPATRLDSKGKVVSDGRYGRDGFSGKDGYDGHAGKDGELIFKLIE